MKYIFNFLTDKKAEADLYLDKEIKTLIANASNVFYQTIITQDMTEDFVVSGRACESALSDHPDLKNWQVFICGAPAMVKFMQQRAYLGGASMQNIHSDPL